MMSTVKRVRKGRIGTWFFGVAWRVGWTAETGGEGKKGDISDFSHIFLAEED